MVLSDWPGRSMHDSWIGLLSELCGMVEFVPEKSIKYRKHKLNQSLQGFSLSQQIKWRYVLVYNLFKRWLNHTSPQNLLP